MSLETRAAILCAFFAAISWSDLLWPDLPWVPTPPAWAQEPTSAEPGPQPPPPLPSSPCSANPAASCVVVPMVIEGHVSRTFTAADFYGQPLERLSENAVCTGSWQRGALRYFYDGTAPTSLVGIPVPYPPDLRTADELVIPGDPAHTLEDNGTTIRLYNREQILGFKAVWANWGGAEITWECQP